MSIRSLSVVNIRSHEDYSITLSPDVTLITGDNGVGKTALLESIYLALQGKSFKGSDKELLRHGEEWWRIELLFGDETERKVTFNDSLEKGKKKFSINNRSLQRLSHAAKIPTVLFEPEDLRLLHGSPNRRRDFIDRLIGQLEPGYMAVVRRYERAVKQRNKLLKDRATNRDDVFVWDVAISNYGAEIIQRRVGIIEMIHMQLNDHYKAIAKSQDVISVHYSDTYIDTISQKILVALHHSFERDHILGTTSVGPHRHDIQFMLNDSPAISSASRGEVRSIILAIKQIESNIIEQVLHVKPIILMDDVFAELDADRQKNLIDSFKDRQTIITSISPIGDFYEITLK